MCGARSGEKPHTIAEFSVMGDKNETYYDISTVDGHNVDMAIIPEESGGTVLSCSLPFFFLSLKKREEKTTPTANNLPLDCTNVDANTGVSKPEKGAPHWCPYELLLTPPKRRLKFDDEILRDYFNPCHSACSKWGRDQDCCSGKYDHPQKCKPGLYSKRIKDVCPDAYSFAYDDRSTFALPSGLGFEVMFCPDGKSSIVSKSKEESCDDSKGPASTQGSRLK